MSDNTVINNMGIAYNEAISISQDSNLTVFTETQISSHATFTNVFSRISVTGANDFQTVFHDVQSATTDDRNFVFSETSDFETVFSAAQLTTGTNFMGMFTIVSLPNVAFTAKSVFTREEITRCLR